MSAPVRFVRSRDGTRIAYTVEGSGPPLIWLPAMPYSHVALYPRLPGVRAFFDALCQTRTVIRVDLRGSGLADRRCTNHSIEALTDDIEAVFEALDIDSADIYGQGRKFMPALCFGARDPRRVRAFAFGGPMHHSVSGLFGLAETNWQLFLETVAQRMSGQPLEHAQWVASIMAHCVGQQDYLAAATDAQLESVAALARQVTAPVLVIYKDVAYAPEGMAAFVAQFPDAALVRLSEEAGTPEHGDPGEMLSALREFLGRGEQPRHRTAVQALSSREEEVLRLLARGQTEAEIGETLCIARATVSRHVQNIYGKLGVHRKAEAVAWAVRHGLA